MSECLGKVKPNMSVREATKEVQNIALDSNFSLPGDPGFPLNQVCLFFFCFLSFRLSLSSFPFRPDRVSLVPIPHSE